MVFSSRINGGNGMVETPRYSADLTGNPLLFAETRMTAKMRCAGLTDDEIVEEIWEHNLYQYNGRKKLRERARAILRRLDQLSPELLKIVAEGPLDLAKLTALYAVAKSNRVVADFIIQVYVPNARLAEGRIEPSDAKEFFRVLREQNEVVAAWSESTIERLRQAVVKMLADAGLLVSTKDPAIIRPIIPASYREALEAVGDGCYAQMLIGGM